MKGVIILGSSNSNGDTRKIVDLLLQELDFDVIDLKRKKIGAYDYAYQNQGDDFIPTIKHIIENYDLLLFATPVYWYSMSGIMKDFFDRLSDCLDIEKELGRQLRGKSLAAISCGYDEKTVQGFHEPFEYTAKYLGMHYKGFLHTHIKDGKAIEEKVKQKVLQFTNQLKGN